MGVTLRALREARGWTQVELAVLAGVALRTIGHIEAGDHIPRIPTRRKLLDALGTDLARHEEVFGPAPVLGRPPRRCACGESLAGDRRARKCAACLTRVAERAAARWAERSHAA